MPISGWIWGIQVEKLEHVFRKRPINNHFKRCACVPSKSKHNTCDRFPCFLVRIIVHSYLWFLWHEMPMLLVAFSVVVSSVSSVSAVVSWVVFQCFHPFISLWDDAPQWLNPSQSPGPQEAQAVVDLDVAFRQLSRSQAGPRVVICCYCIWYVVIICYHDILDLIRCPFLMQLKFLWLEMDS